MGWTTRATVPDVRIADAARGRARLWAHVPRSHEHSRPAGTGEYVVVHEIKRWPVGRDGLYQVRIIDLVEVHHIDSLALKYGERLPSYCPLRAYGRLTQARD